ncbi:MAG: DUF192 domain-containing protein [Chthonomonadales bacterium]
MGNHSFRLLHAASGVQIASRAVIAGSLGARIKGLIGRTRLEPGEALWLEPCNGIHTFGMRFPLDVLTLDRTLRIVRLYRAVQPNRILLPARGGYITIEAPIGTIERCGLREGDLVVRMPLQSDAR